MASRLSSRVAGLGRRLGVLSAKSLILTASSCASDRSTRSSSSSLTPSWSSWKEPVNTRGTSEPPIDADRLSMIAEAVGLMWYRDSLLSSLLCEVPHLLLAVEIPRLLARDDVFFAFLAGPGSA